MRVMAQVQADRLHQIANDQTQLLVLADTIEMSLPSTLGAWEGLWTPE